MIITGAIFDLDGTLIDSMPMWHNFVKIYLDKYGFTPDDYLKANAKDLSFAESGEYINKHYPIHRTPEEIAQDMWDTAGDAYANTIAIKHDVKPFLFALRCKGVRMCIATASPREWAEAVLKELSVSFQKNLFSSDSIIIEFMNFRNGFIEHLFYFDVAFLQ